MNAAKHAGLFHALARLGDLIHADIVIDGGFLREPPAAEIADDFADDAGVAFDNLAGFLGLHLNNHRRGGIECKLAVESV